MFDGHVLTAQFVDALNFKFPIVNSYDEGFGVTTGQRFNKIVRTRNGEPTSVFAFVEVSTGKLVKAAGYNKPAKRTNGELQSKYNLNEDFTQAIEEADRFGSFLYIR